MDFHHLKYFVEVADQKSFSKAARNLHISQSAISRTIKALEDELGVVLFMRNAKSVELTDGGTIFLTHAKRVVFMFEHLKTDFENEFRLEQGSIRIGIPPITDAPIFAQLLGEFKKVYPQIELELYEHCLLYTSICSIHIFTATMNNSFYKVCKTGRNIR